MKKILLALACVSTTALADPAALTRCRAVSEASARLACYDAITLPAPSSAPARTREPVSTIAPPPASPAQFGLVAKEDPNDLKTIQSTIPGRFAGWKPRTRITLANGQVWQITDDSSGFCDCDNPKVTVERRAFGGYWLEIEGKTHSPSVKRLK